MRETTQNQVQLGKLSPTVFLRDHVTYAIFGLVTLYFVVAAPSFASIATLEAILRITAIVSIMAVGMTFVIISAEIDLSVGSMASLSGMIGAMLIEAGVPWGAAFCAHIGLRRSRGRILRLAGYLSSHPFVPGNTWNALRAFGGFHSP